MSYILKLFFALVFLLSLPTNSIAQANSHQIPTVDNVDLASYLGQWYEVRRIPNDFQDNEPKPGDGPCFNSTAEYSALPNEKIKVTNICNRKSRSEVAIAKARVVSDSNNAKLKVNFTGVPFLEWLGIGDADYWILALGEKNSENLYSWVLVGTPKLDYGWILSRTALLPDSEIESALKTAESVGYERRSFQNFQR
jgi:apolipoprotein D and lipocalin family protein